eukprot:COSAG02_NODE_1979_length_10203_cov_19.985748_10_plen_98_part_00
MRGSESRFRAGEGFARAVLVLCAWRGAAGGRSELSAWGLLLCAGSAGEQLWGYERFWRGDALPWRRYQHGRRWYGRGLGDAGVFLSAILCQITVVVA